MTNAYDKLREMKACVPALRWIGDRTIEQAWRECERGGWMCWLLKRIAPGDPRLRLAAADMAERVWDLITDEPMRLTAAWAIDAARRGDEDEMDAASHAATTAYAVHAYATHGTYAAASDNATYAAAEAAAVGRLEHAADNAASAADNAAHGTYAAVDAYAAESAAQADILREYFSAREIGDLFRQAPA